MPFERVTPPPRVAPVSLAPVKASIKLRRDGKPVVWLSMNEAGQKELFGQYIAGVKLDVRAGMGTDFGLLELTLKSSGKHEARKSVRGAVRIPVGTWEGIPAIEVKAKPCGIERSNPDAMLAVIRLPDWHE